MEQEIARERERGEFELPVKDVRVRPMTSTIVVTKCVSGREAEEDELGSSCDVVTRQDELTSRNKVVLVSALQFVAKLVSFAGSSG
jgi:hypothetical protein